jgi:hypothetical protein
VARPDADCTRAGVCAGEIEGASPPTRELARNGESISLGRTKIPSKSVLELTIREN